MAELSLGRLGLHYETRTTCGCSTCQDQADEVRYDLQGDDPPWVSNFHFGLLGLFGIIHDTLDVLFGNSCFHDILGLGFRDAKVRTISDMARILTQF